MASSIVPLGARDDLQEQQEHPQVITKQTRLLEGIENLVFWGLLGCNSPEMICVLRGTEPGASLPLTSGTGWWAWFQVDFLCVPRMRRVLQSSWRCFIPTQLSEVHPPCPPAWIWPPIPYSFPPHCPCWCCSTLAPPGDLWKQEHGEEGFWGTPASHPHKVGTHPSFIPSFFTLAADT